MVGAVRFSESGIKIEVQLSEPGPHNSAVTVWVICGMANPDKDHREILENLSR